MDIHIIDSWLIWVGGGFSWKKNNNCVDFSFVRLNLRSKNYLSLNLIYVNGT